MRARSAPNQPSWPVVRLHGRRHFAAIVIGIVILLVFLVADTAWAQATGDSLPFAVGEHLVYDAHAGPGLNGKADMWIEGPVDVRGTPTMVLRFTFSARIGFLRVSDNTTSWLDPVRMSSLRFTKEEHHLLARHSEDVSIEPLARKWTAADGREGNTPSARPLDELSFIYAVRTFALADGGPPLVLDRHFDPERSPTTLRSLGSGSVTTSVGVFATREVEMRVRDARNYKGEGIIRFSLSDDACRRPIRIESNIPGAGSVVLTLASALPVIAACEPHLLAARGQ
ncbi:MAG: DUF3108 domain-containing protein [Gemmatimonadota bacterium]|nr:DUF3108 domain-containing protein [Gemmatimonadota bacterium]